MLPNHGRLPGGLIILGQSEKGTEVPFIDIEGRGVMLNGFIKLSRLARARAPGEQGVHRLGRGARGPSSARSDEEGDEKGDQKTEGECSEQRHERGNREQGVRRRG